MSLLLSGIDSDAASVSVEISDGGDNSVSADATYDESTGWTVADLDLTGLADGTLTVSASVTDVAGNDADAVSASLELDTVADIGNDLSAVFVDGDDSVLNDSEATDGAIFVSGFSAPDLQSVAATVTGGADSLTVTASLGDLANGIPPAVAMTVVGYDGELTVRFSSDPADTTSDVSLVAQPLSPSVGGLTHAVDFADPANIAGAADLVALFAAGEFYAQAYDSDGVSRVSSLIDQSNLSVSVAVTDPNGNTDSVTPSDVAFLDMSADVDQDLGLVVDSVVNDAESGSVQITLSGIDADVASPGGIVVSVGDSNVDEIAAAQTARDNANSELATLNAQLTPLVAIASLEQLGLDELNAALNAAQQRQSEKQIDKDLAEADYNAAYTEAVTGFVSSNADPSTLNDGDAVVAPIASQSVTIDADAVAAGATWSQAQIDALTGDMDTFVAAYTWPDTQGQTVDQLESALSDAVAQLAAVDQQVAESTSDHAIQQGIADAAAGLVIAKGDEIDNKQDELDEAVEALDALLGEDLTGVTATYVSGNTWQADVSGLDDGTLAVQAAVTDAAGNTATASGNFTLDTTADLEDDTVLAVSVDSVINDEESGNVTLTLSGVDADAETVVVTLTDSDGTAVTAAAVAGDNGDWTVDVSGGALIDGNVSVAVDMTDDAGNTASAATGFDLDTTADLEDDTVLAVSVDSVINDEESGNVTLTLSGVDADAETVVVTLTDSDGTAVQPQRSLVTTVTGRLTPWRGTHRRKCIGGCRHDRRRW